jgi:hypothetical protein
MSAMRFLPVNRQAILVELADLQQTLVLLGALQAKSIEGVQELVLLRAPFWSSSRPISSRRQNWSRPLRAAI